MSRTEGKASAGIWGDANRDLREAVDVASMIVELTAMDFQEG